MSLHNQAKCHLLYEPLQEDQKLFLEPPRLGATNSDKAGAKGSIKALLLVYTLPTWVRWEMNG